MFTGIVEKIGRVKKIERQQETMRLELLFPATDLTDARIGDSIAVNGVCLTLIAVSRECFVAEAMPETYRATNLAVLKPGDAVNLERALPLSGRLDGHFVSGHVDGIVKIKRRWQEQNAIYYQLTTLPSEQQHIVKKGSITLDGTSLTIVDKGKTTFTVALIPHSASHTVLGHKGVNDVVNLESDLISKYLGALLSKQTASVTHDFLQQHGY